MKKLIILTILSFKITTTYSQLGLGQSLSEIKKEDSVGVFDINEEKLGFIYFYYKKDVQSKIVHMLNVNLLCYETIVIPNDKNMVKLWKLGLDESSMWHKTKNKNEWLMKRDDGIIITCLKDKDKNKKTIYIFNKLN